MFFVRQITSFNGLCSGDDLKFHAGVDVAVAVAVAVSVQYK